MYSQQPYFQTIPVSPMVKRLIIVNIGIWFSIQLILENIFFHGEPVTLLFSFTPKKTFEDFYFWQPLTYMFFHSKSVFHVLLNMISLWFFGSELEYRWGSRNFLYYYLTCGVGASLIYFMGVVFLGWFRGVMPAPYFIPVLGASGAVFGVLLAYGILFGQRIIYFFGVFPMMAKTFVMIICGIEVVSLLNTGLGGSKVANLAHIGGLVVGYLYLFIWTGMETGTMEKVSSSKGKGWTSFKTGDKQKEKKESSAQFNLFFLTLFNFLLIEGGSGQSFVVVH